MTRGVGFTNVVVESRRPSRVLVDQAAEPIPPDDHPGRLGWLWAAERRAQVECAVGPRRVVVRHELAQDRRQVTSAEDE